MRVSLAYPLPRLICGVLNHAAPVMKSALSPERWEQIQHLFNEVVELDPEARAARLEEDCRDDPALREEVDSLLKAYAQADDLLEVLDTIEGSSSSSAVSSPSRTGTTVSHYEILEKLGGGGMGVVYKARDTRLDRLVALKFLPHHLSSSEEAKQRFIHEAQSASVLDDPHICTIHDISETEEGQLFIAMAYYRGETIKKKIARGPMPLEEALDYTIQIARGLSRAHEAGITHRDIKPANVMVTDRGQVKIVDFGLAKAATGMGLTKTGTTLGTAAYMSPEQARGVNVDTRTDVWALGVVLYEMLAGERPFKGDYEQAMIYGILNQEPEPLREVRPEVSEPLAQIVEKLLHKDLSKRYQTMAEVLVALGVPPDTVSVSNLHVLPVAAQPPRARLRWAIAAGATVLLVLGGLWAVLPFRPSPAESPPALQTSIAVLPFSVEGDETLAYLETGMVTLLSAKIDGIGELRSVDANTLIGYIERHPNQVLDPRQGQAIAAHFNAEGYILGRILKVGGTIQINASLYDSDGAAPVRAEVSIAADSLLLGAVDDLARQLISSRLTAPGQQLASMAALTSSSFPALKAFLDGEQAIRERRWVPAFQAFEHAVEADSTFALAWYRLANAAEWGANPRVATFSASAMAVRHSRGLPDRTRQLILAQDAHVNGRAEEEERLYRSLLAKDPNDALAWYRLGETLNHYNRYYGRPTAQARRPFERALALDPHNEEIRHHLVELAAEEQRFADFDTLAVGYLESLNEARALAWRALRVLAGERTAAREQALAQLEQADWMATWHTLNRATAYLEDLPLAERLAERLTTVANNHRAQASGYMSMGNVNVAQGRERAARIAYAQADSLRPTWRMFIHQALGFHLLYSYPREDLEALRDEIARWDTVQAPLEERSPLVGNRNLFVGKQAILRAYLLGLTNWRLGENEAVEAHMAELDRRGAAQPDDSLAYSLARTLDGLLAWRQGEPDRALDALDAARMRFPHWTFSQWFYENSLVRYLRAEILYGEGRYEEALPWFTSLDDGGDVVEARAGMFYLGPSYLRRAQIYEALGEHENAIAFYRRFVTLWKDCEPELRPQVEAAQERLDRLLDGAVREPADRVRPGASSP